MLALDAYPAVLESAVKRAPFGLSEDYVVAVVVPRPGAAPSQEALRAWCGARLARLKVPSRVVLTDALPTTPTAKAQKDRP